MYAYHKTRAARPTRAASVPARLEVEHAARVFGVTPQGNYGPEERFERVRERDVRSRKTGPVYNDIQLQTRTRG